MTYVVAGVSGNTGRIAAEALLAQGKEVRVLVRDPSKGHEWEKRGAQVAVADLADVAGVTRALQGAVAAYLLVPPTFTAKDFLAYQRGVSDALTEAIQAAALPHVVILSSIGAHLPEGTGPIRGLHYLENKLRKLPQTQSTFLRAAYFMENIASSLSLLDQGLYPSFSPADVAFDMVATRDIGAAAAQLLVEGAKATSVVDIAGPKRSPNDVANVLSAILGKPIHVAEAPVSTMAATLSGFGMPADLAGLYQEMTEGMLSGKVASEPGHRKIAGTTDLEAVLRPLLKR